MLECAAGRQHLLYAHRKVELCGEEVCESKICADCNLANHIFSRRAKVRANKTNMHYTYT